jgi:hypothetical protein
VKTPPGRGLPARIYLPILLVIAVVFLGTMGYLLRIGFGVTGSPFGADVNTVTRPIDQKGTSTQGGPPPVVPREQER